MSLMSPTSKETETETETEIFLAIFEKLYQCMKKYTSSSKPKGKNWLLFHFKNTIKIQITLKIRC